MVLTIHLMSTTIGQLLSPKLTVKLGSILRQSQTILVDTNMILVGLGIMTSVLPSTVVAQSRIILSLDHLLCLSLWSSLIQCFVLSRGRLWSTTWTDKKSATLRHLDSSTLSEMVLLLARVAKTNSEKGR